VHCRGAGRELTPRTDERVDPYQLSLERVDTVTPRKTGGGAAAGPPGLRRVRRAIAPRWVGIRDLPLRVAVGQGVRRLEGS